MQLVRTWECWTFCGTNFSCWSIASKSVKVQLSMDRKRSYDWLTANERMRPVCWADIRGEECRTSLRTSALEAKNDKDCVGLSSAVFKTCGQRLVNISYNLWSEVHCMQSVVCSLQSTVCSLQMSDTTKSTTSQQVCKFDMSKHWRSDLVVFTQIFGKWYNLSVAWLLW